MLTRSEIAQMGGLALAAKVDPIYFKFIGRRGGRLHVYRANMASAAEYLERGDLEMFEHFLAKAAQWRDELGCRVMLELWLAGAVEPLPARRPANTDEARLRRWQRAQAPVKARAA